MRDDLLSHLRVLPAGARRKRARAHGEGGGSETALFLKRWIKAPLVIGALAPSSRHLGRAMARQVDVGAGGLVIELGGGTGSITRALLEAGLPPERLVVVEQDPTLHALLERSFPAIPVIRGDAAHLVQLLRPMGISRAAAIVSGLPLLSMPRHLRRRIVEESFAFLGESGSFIQFTYSLASPLPRREFAIEGAIAQRIWRNFPPAAVWRFQRPPRPALRLA